MNLFIYLNLIFKKIIIILFFLKIFPILQDKKKCKQECVVLKEKAVTTYLNNKPSIPPII